MTVVFSLTRLVSGATWQSSGHVSHLQNTLIETHFAKYSRVLYEQLHRQGHDIGRILLLFVFSSCSINEILFCCHRLRQTPVNNV
jgi:hypothetical protein